MKPGFGRVITASLLLSMTANLPCRGQGSRDSGQAAPDDVQTLRQEVTALRDQLARQQEAMARIENELSELRKVRAGAGSSTIEEPARQTAQDTASPAVSSPQPLPQRSAAEGLVERFRFSGDVRIRFEPILQELSPARYRARLRVRFGVEGKLSEDFSGGFYLATGTVSDDAVATNATYTQFFTRKAIGLDRGWVTYRPQAGRWLELTGGKFAYTWERTPLTFDTDLNPEGFSEKLSFDLDHAFFRNISLVGMQLWFNEVPGSTLPFALGNDSFAAGGQIGTRVQWRKGLATNFTAMALNWQNPDSIIQAITAGTLAGNRNTNATVGSGASIAYASEFLYAAFQADTTLETPWERFPARLLLNFVDNPRAASDQRHGFWGEVQLGGLQRRHDLQFGYGFARIEQDAVLAAFNESEQRAPTNVLQHRIALQWLAQRNTIASFAGWIGRTLDRNLQNAALPAGLPAGRTEPYVKRLQFDLTYRF